MIIAIKRINKVEDVILSDHRIRLERAEERIHVLEIKQK